MLTCKSLHALDGCKHQITQGLDLHLNARIGCNTCNAYLAVLVSLKDMLLIYLTMAIRLVQRNFMLSAVE